MGRTVLGGFPSVDTWRFSASFGPAAVCFTPHVTVARILLVIAQRFPIGDNKYNAE